MSAKFYRRDRVGYSHWITFLCNGDSSGLTDAELAECMQWLAFHNLRACECIGIVSDNYFGRPDWMADARPGNVYEYIFHTSKQ